MPRIIRALPLMLALPSGIALAQAPGNSTSAPPLLPIASVIADADKDTIPDLKGRRVRVRGTVTIPTGVLNRNAFQVVIDDGGAGVTLFNRELETQLAPGDHVEAVGTVQQHRGAVQLYDAQVRRLGRRTLPAVEPVAAARVNGRSHMGRRVRVEGVVGDLALDAFANLQLTGDDGTQISIFVPPSATSRFDWSDYRPGARISATGVVSIYKTKWPYDSGYQLIVTAPADMRVIAPPPPAWRVWLPWGLLGFAALLASGLAVFHLLQVRHKARQRELATLAALSAAVAQPELGEEQLARHTCEILTAYHIVDAAMVQVFDGRGRLTHLAASTGDRHLPLALEFYESPTTGAGDPKAKAQQQRIEARLLQHGLSVLAIQPLHATSEPLGFLIALSPRPRRQSGQQERILLAAGKLLAMALENSRLKHQSERERLELQQMIVTDQLTGLYNRRFLDEYLRIQVPLAVRRGTGLAFLAIDIDQFKVVNDAWGHDVGDQVLIGVAADIHEASRSSDLGVRLGGDEFLAVIAEADPGKAMAFAERLRTIIESRAFADLAEDHTLRVTISLGVAVLGLHGDTAEALLRASDEALYASKRDGRNRVTLAQVAGAEG